MQFGGMRLGVEAGIWGSNRDSHRDELVILPRSGCVLRNLMRVDECLQAQRQVPTTLAGVEHDACKLTSVPPISGVRRCRGFGFPATLLSNHGVWC